MKLKTFVKENRKFLRNIIVSTSIGLGASVFGYYYNVLLAKGLPEEKFGIYSSALGIVYLILIPSTAITSVITKLIAKNRGKDLREFKKRIFFKFLLITSAISLLFYACSPLISSIANIPQECMLPLTLVLFFSFFSSITKGIYYGIERPNMGNFLSLIEAVLRLLIGIWIVNYYADSATLPILAFALPLVLTGLCILPFVGNREGKGSEELEGKVNLKEILIYSTIFLFLTTPYTLDLSLVNPDFRASYSALSLIGKIVYFASILISSVMFSKLANLKSFKEKKKTLWLSLGITSFIGLCSSLIFELFSNQVISFVYGDTYGEITQYIGIFSIGMTLYACIYLIYNFFIIENYIKSVWLIIGTTILQILLFVFRNGSLKQVVENQMFLYVLLFVSSTLLLIFYNRRKKMDGTEKY